MNPIITTFDQQLVEKLNNWQPGGWYVGNLILMLIALVLSVILCGAIGLEREWKGRSAGLRTHLLVGVGSCIIMIISIYGFPALFNEKRDVARLAAQVIAGVGFLGAGAIIHRNSGVKGLTTAGTIWIVMAIGIACGSLNFILAIAGTLVIILVLTLFRRVEIRLAKKNPTFILVTKASTPVVGKILKVARDFDSTVHAMSSSLIGSGEDANVEVVFQVNFDRDFTMMDEFLAALEKETGATSVQLLNRK